MFVICRIYLILSIYRLKLDNHPHVKLIESSSSQNLQSKYVKILITIPIEIRSNIPDEIIQQIVGLLRNNLGAQYATTNSENLSLGIKFSDNNFALWATLVRKVIRGRRRDSHITREPSPHIKKDQV